MKFNGAILTFGLCAMILTGCSGAQDGAVTPVTASQSRMHRASGSSGDLIYVSATQTYILSYADGSIQGTLPQSGGAAGLCSDAQGNVFLPTPSVIYEYAHGGTTPINELEDPYRPGACSIDPSTGDLAVCNASSGDSNQPGNLAVFKGASGSPKFYTTPKLSHYYSCAYDGSGNLFIGGTKSGNAFHFAERSTGSSQIEMLKLDRKVLSVGRMQWDGKRLAIAVNNANMLYRVSISGSNATVTGVTKLYGVRTTGNLNFWIQGSTILTSAGPHSGSVGIWRYPRGGKLQSLYHVIRKGLLDGITVSAAPTTSRK